MSTEKSDKLIKYNKFRVRYYEWINKDKDYNII